MHSFFRLASEKGDKSQNIWLSNSEAKRGCSLINPPTYWGIMKDMPFWFLLLITIEQSVLKFQTNIRTTDSQEPVIRRRYRTLSQTREMTEESDARIERLEKASQDQHGHLAEITKLLKTLVRDKAQAAGQQNSVVQPELRREDLTYP